MKDKKIPLKILAITLLVGIILGGILFNPKPAYAGIPVIDWVQQAKEFVIDTIVKSMAKTFMRQMIRDITRWAAGGFRDENQPFAITNWSEYFKTAVNVGSAMFINKFKLTPLCYPIRISLEDLGFTTYHIYLPSYQMYAACTIGDIVENVEDFWENPSIGMYGWGTWSALTQPQNNIYGSWLLATEERERLEAEEVEAKTQEATVSGGYQNQVICTKDQETECKQNCHHIVAEETWEMEACLHSCETASLGICLQEWTKTTGSEIHEAIKKAIGADADWIISADEISELLGAFITGVTQRLISGFYDYQTPSPAPPPPPQPPSPAETQTILNQVKEGIFESIKQMSKNINQINPESQLTITEMSDIIFPLFEEQTLHLYSAIEGVEPEVDSIIPDKYPQQIADWVSQAIVKYPMVAKSNICIGSPVKILTQPCQPIPASEIQFPGSCSMGSTDPNCPNCINPYCLLTFASIRNYSRFCSALSADDSYCESGTVIPSEHYCGDNILDVDEECDDGNNISGDGCSATCELEQGYY